MGRAFCSSRSDRGQTIVFLVLILFVLFGVAGWAIDMAVVRDTQRKMQTATDTAALEGLRERDSGGSPRLAARTAVRQVFDDDFDFTSDPLQLGAGPILDGSPGIGFANAAQTFTVFGTYDDPVLQFNDNVGNPNRPEGDMLAGNYDAVERHDEGYNPDNPYFRDDFAAYDPTNGVADPNSFLVRMRRSSNFSGLDDIATVSSSERSLPLVFARGSLVRGEAGDPYNPRIHGITVHANSIADGQSSLSAGPPQPAGISGVAGGIDGLAPFGLTTAYWNSLTTGVGAPAVVTAAGEVQSPPGTRVGQILGLTQVGGGGIAPSVSGAVEVIPVTGSAGFAAGGFRIRIGDELLDVIAAGGAAWTVIRGVEGTTAAAHAAGSNISLHAMQTIGASIAAMSSAPPSSFVPFTTANEINVPIFEVIPGAGERIIGFGRATMAPAGPLGFPRPVTITRLASLIADRNTTGRLAESLAPLGLTTAQVDALFAARTTYEEPLLSPVLVRSDGL